MTKTTPQQPICDAATHANLLLELLALRNHMQQAVEMNRALLASVHPEQRPGAINLLQYLAFRARDIRTLQDQLHVLGLSSLASSESHIAAQVEQVLQRLCWQAPDKATAPVCSYQQGKDFLEAHTNRLFGPRQGAGVNHIMITLDESSGGNTKLLCAAMQKGMDIARINCAHDDPETWSSWIANVRTAGKQTGTTCKIYMDLPGPKMRMQILAGAGKKGRIRIKPGDEIRLLEAGEQPDKHVKTMACQEPGIVLQLQDGNKVLVDDGKYSGEIKRRGSETWLLITHVTGKKPRLEADKGINFPCASLRVPVITQTDAGILPFIAAHADMMGCSFIRSAEDVAILREALAAYAQQPDLILKIETPEAMLHLPELLLEAMKNRSCGVMIARGDLAVELGFSQLSDVQDKILWLCEAAHVPVIWATQVLENLNKTGLATRSEVTDAAHACKAECVMLNKGEFLLETLDTLQEILHLTDSHRHKKRYTLRPLAVAKEFFQRHPPSSSEG